MRTRGLRVSSKKVPPVAGSNWLSSATTRMRCQSSVSLQPHLLNALCLGACEAGPLHDGTRKLGPRQARECAASQLSCVTSRLQTQRRMDRLYRLHPLLAGSMPS